MSELSCEWQHSSHTRKWRPMRWQFVSWGDQSEARMSPEPWSWCGYEGNINVEGNVVIMGNWSSDICPAILYWLNSAWRIGSQSNHNTLQITDYYHPIKTPNVTLHWCWHVFFIHIFCPSVKKRYVYLYFVQWSLSLSSWSWWRCHWPFLFQLDFLTETV